MCKKEGGDADIVLRALKERRHLASGDVNHRELSVRYVTSERERAQIQYSGLFFRSFYKKTMLIIY